MLSRDAHEFLLCTRGRSARLPQTLVAELAVDALQRAVLPRLAGINQGGLDVLIDDPIQQRA